MIVNDFDVVEIKNECRLLLVRFKIFQYLLAR